MKKYNKLINLKLFDEKTTTLIYTAKAVGGLKQPQEKAMELAHAILFIDDVCLSCWGG